MSTMSELFESTYENRPTYESRLAKETHVCYKELLNLLEEDYKNPSNMTFGDIMDFAFRFKMDEEFREEAIFDAARWLLMITMKMNIILNEYYARSKT